jgi:hypothetical protein
MQWLTMSWPTPRTMPRRAASSTLVPTPSVEATSTGSSRAVISLAENTPPKLPTPRTTARAVGALDGGLHLIHGPGALVDVDPGRGVRGEHCSGCSPADVAPHLHAVEVDVIDRVVRGTSGGGEVGAEAGDGQHPTAGDPAVVAAGGAGHAGGEHSAWSPTGPTVTRPPVTGADGYPGAAATTVHAAPGAMRVLVGQPALGARQCHRGEVGVEQREHRLCLGVAEAAVVLDEPWARSGEHEAGVEHADVGRPFGGQVVEHRLDEGGHEVVGIERDRRRRVRPHAAGVGAGVALADALVVLGERQCTCSAPVAQCEQGALGPLEALLEHERALRRDGADGVDRVVGPSGTMHALAGGQTVELHHHGCAEFLEPRNRLVGTSKRSNAGPARRVPWPARGPGPSTTRAWRDRRSGRSTAMPRRAHSSAVPATSAASGPTMTRSVVSTVASPSSSARVTSCP